MKRLLVALSLAATGAVLPECEPAVDAWLRSTPLTDEALAALAARVDNAELADALRSIEGRLLAARALARPR